MDGKGIILVGDGGIAALVAGGPLIGGPMLDEDFRRKTLIGGIILLKRVMGSKKPSTFQALEF
jgi:hypothetical protein